MRNKFSAALFAALFAFAGCSKDKDGPQKYILDNNSVIEWRGNLDNGFNNGSFDIGTSSIEVKNGTVTGGRFVFPIASIKNFNLPDDQKEQLLHHLKSIDFFNMAVYPDVTFVITAVQPYTGGIPEAVEDANYLVQGKLTMLGKTHPIVFAASIVLENSKIDITAKCWIDRTKWGMNYASDPAGQLYIHKNVALTFALTGQRK